jgi:hypothetical protein
MRKVPTVSPSDHKHQTYLLTDPRAGTYNVTVTDGYNCEFISADIIIDQPIDIQASLVV